MHKLGNMAPEISRLDMFRTLLEDRSLVVFVYYCKAGPSVTAQPLETSVKAITKV